MIDYEKLKLAHELCYKLPFDIYSFDCWYRGYATWYVFTYEDCEKINHEHESEDIDKLITKLQELTQEQPKAKFKVGDEVWVRSDKDFIEGEIVSIEFKKHRFIYDINFDYIDSGIKCREPEDELYTTREALIEAQIEYWTCLLNQEKSTGSEDVSMAPTFEGEIKGLNQFMDKHKKVCEHEEDGFGYDKRKSLEDPHDMWLKCKKCGEFYR